MRSVAEIIGNNIDKWLEIAPITAFVNGGTKTAYASMELTDSSDGTYFYKKIRTKPFPTKILLNAPIFYGRRYPQLGGFLYVPDEIKSDFQTLSFIEARNIQAYISLAKRDTNSK